MVFSVNMGVVKIKIPEARFKNISAHRTLTYRRHGVLTKLYEFSCATTFKLELNRYYPTRYPTKFILRILLLYKKKNCFVIKPNNKNTKRTTKLLYAFHVVIFNILFARVYYDMLPMSE